MLFFSEKALRIVRKFNVAKLGLGEVHVGLGSVGIKFSNYNLLANLKLNWLALSHAKVDYVSCRHLTYVERMKKLDSFKKDPLADATAKAFQMGKYLLFKNKTVLMNKNVLEVLKEGVHISGKEYQSYEAVWLSFKDIRDLNLDKSVNEDSGLGDCCVLLNIDNNGTPLFALQFDHLEEDVEIELGARFSGAFLQIEVAMFLGTTQKSATFEQAQSLLKWNRHFQFCYVCGNKLHQNTIGLQKICSNCEKVHYPKPDPAVITVITDETNRKCLLVRQKKFPPGMYTAIAGFLEMGENVEDTVRREVAEEVGLHVEKIDYITSQHWPLRGTTLMLGCLAIVKPGGMVELDKNEIEDARWFSTDELAAALALSGNDPSLRLKNKGGDLVWVPPKPTIANTLLTAWVKKNSDKK